jgi:peroxiredoxin
MRGIMMLLLLGMLVVPISHTAGAEPPATLQLGQAAPDFCLPGADGKQHCLGDFADAKVLVIIFTCNHCPAAQAYETRIKQLVDRYRERGVAVVAISPNDPKALRLDELGYTDLNDSLDEMKLRAKAHDFNFPYLYDGDDQKASRAYGPVTTPHAFLFDADRRLRYVGRIDDSAKPSGITSHDLPSAIEATLTGKPIAVAKTRTFGCSVKWSDKRSSAEASLEKWAKEKVTLERIDPAGVRALANNKTGKLLLINVWATWCGPCRTEFPELVTIHRMYRKRDFQMITISADPSEQESAALAFLQEVHASSRNFLFVGKNEHQLADALDEKWQGGLPYTLLVAPGGKVIYRKQGELDALELKRAIVKRLGRVYK